MHTSVHTPTHTYDFKILGVCMNACIYLLLMSGLKLTILLPQPVVY